MGAGAGAAWGADARAISWRSGSPTKAIEHRVATGRLHPIARGIYAVGRPELTPHGRWMAAVLVCGDGAALSHRSAAELWGIGYEEKGRIDVTVAARMRDQAERAQGPRPRSNCRSGAWCGGSGFR